jgi:hypothetical protein
LPILGVGSGRTCNGEDDRLIFDIMLKYTDTLSVCQGQKRRILKIKTHMGGDDEC